jgi:hypothetical protein
MSFMKPWNDMCKAMVPGRCSYKYRFTRLLGAITWVVVGIVVSVFSIIYHTVGPILSLLASGVAALFMVVFVSSVAMWSAIKINWRK